MLSFAKPSSKSLSVDLGAWGVTPGADAALRVAGFEIGEGFGVDAVKEASFAGAT